MTTEPETIVIQQQIAIPADLPARVAELKTRAVGLFPVLEQLALEVFEITKVYETVEFQTGYDESASDRFDTVTGMEELRSALGDISAMLCAADYAQSGDYGVPPAWFETWEREVRWPAELASPYITEERKRLVQGWLAHDDADHMTPLRGLARSMARESAQQQQDALDEHLSSIESKLTNLERIVDDT